jgi:SH3 domain-containing protein
VRQMRAAPLAHLALGAALLGPGSAQAQDLYVIDQLVVNLNSAADASGERVATLKSGDKVQLIERAGDAVHVRVSDGRDGWLRATYLSADEPASVRLAARDRQLAQLKDDLARARAQPAPAPASAPVRTPAAATAGEDAATTAPLFEPAPIRPRPAWPLALGCGLLGLALGFASGVLILDRYIRRRFGGLRIY